jgi:hypothetical protein
VREREDANRARETGHLDKIQRVVASTLNSFRQGAAGFIDWLGCTESFNGTFDVMRGKFVPLRTRRCVLYFVESPLSVF